MAPGKKQKKSKSKRSKDSPSGLVSKDCWISFYKIRGYDCFKRNLFINFQSHIASTLVPSAIFAAVPRTPTNLAQTWPRRTPSPIVQALGEAGNIGRVLIGDLSKRPPAELPANQEEGDRNGPEHANGHDRDERLENEEVGYESVQDGKPFDKTTKYFRMSQGESSSAPREEVEGATNEGDPSQHFYHILDHENGQVVEPVAVYSRVDKRKKAASKQSADGDKDEVLELKSVFSS